MKQPKNIQISLSFELDLTSITLCKNINALLRSSQHDSRAKLSHYHHAGDKEAGDTAATHS
jgi:hypothetical protein